MTGVNGRVSQVSQVGWDWFRVSAYKIQANDYEVLAVRTGEGWGYFAYTPELKISKVDGGFVFDGLHPYKISYGIGDVVPPSFSVRTLRARALIGIKYESLFGDALLACAAAKLLCVNHCGGCDGGL